MRRVAVVGAGSWGTALAIHLQRNGTPTTLWARSARLARRLESDRENREYLAGYPFPEDLGTTSDIARAVSEAGLVLFVVPVQASREIYAKVAPYVAAGADLLIASKGIEEKNLETPSQVLLAELGANAAPRVAVLSGPSFAPEVARGDPTAVVVAGEDDEALRRIQRTVSRGNLRVYRNSDRIGVETAGALKNIMALASGVVDGIGLGANTRAALITRGMAEMTRLGVAMGGRAETFAGLAGAGDLILTCTGELSRNRRVGIELGRGRPLDEILSSMKMVAEGVATTRAALALAERYGVEMPIATEVHAVLFEGRAPREAISALLSRPPKEES